MTSIVRPVSRYRRLLLSAPTAALAVTIVAGCSGGSDDATDALPAANGSSTDNGAAGTGQPTGAPSAPSGAGSGRSFPGASGQIADITGKTLQVQNTSTQTAVTWTDATKVTNSVSATKADLTAGDCVQIRDTAQDSVDNAGATSGPMSGGLSPAAIVDPDAAIEASSVAISDAVDGACNAGSFAGFGGSRPQGAPQGGQAPQGMPQGMPEGIPEGMPQGAPDGAGSGTRPDGARGAFGGGANGKVVKIDGDTITVESTRPAAPSSDGSTTGEASTSTRTVTLVSGTTYTKTVSATASALKVGSCVTALGTADDAGAISATSIAISPAVNGACTGGMSGRFGAGANGNDTAAGTDNG